MDDYPIVIIEKTCADIDPVLCDYQKSFGFYMTPEKMDELKASFVSMAEDSGSDEVRAKVVIIEELSDKDKIINDLEAIGMRFATPLELLLFAQQCNAPKAYIQKNKDLEIHTLVRGVESVPQLLCPLQTEFGFIYRGPPCFDLSGLSLFEWNPPVYGDIFIPSSLSRFKKNSTKEVQFLTVLLR